MLCLPTSANWAEMRCRTLIYTCFHVVTGANTPVHVTKVCYEYTTVQWNSVNPVTDRPQKSGCICINSLAISALRVL